MTIFFPKKLNLLAIPILRSPIFEKAFKSEVEVELLKSVKMGDDICLMKIIPLTPIRF